MGGRIAAVFLAAAFLALFLSGCGENSALENTVSAGAEGEIRKNEAGKVPAERMVKKIDMEGMGKRIYFWYDPLALTIKAPHIMTEDSIRSCVAEAVENGADVLATELYGMVPMYPSKVYPLKEHEKWFEETFEESGTSLYSI